MGYAVPYMPSTCKGELSGMGAAFSNNCAARYSPGAQRGGSKQCVVYHSLHYHLLSLSCVAQVNSLLNSCGFFLFPPALEREGREQESSGVVVSFWLSLNDDT